MADHRDAHADWVAHRVADRGAPPGVPVHQGVVEPVHQGVVEAMHQGLVEPVLRREDEPARRDAAEPVVDLAAV